MKLLLVGDEAKNRRVLRGDVDAAGWDVATATTLTAVERALAPGNCGMMVVDWAMGGGRREEILDLVRRSVPTLPVVALSRTRQHEEEARACGLTLCVQPPLSAERLLELARPPQTNASPRNRARPAAQEASPAGLPVMDSVNPMVRTVYERAWRAAATDVTLMISGENGTGKTMLARAVHERSTRRDGPFLTVNCPSLQSKLVESELFGHVRGAFTGAVIDTVGKVAAAEGGTLFLDEVGELPLEIQPKLLRLLQEREYERLGESKTRRANVRVVAATNRDLKREVAEGRFREDLFYRLNVVSLQVLPLRHRPEDIIPAAEQFLEGCRRGLGRDIAGFSQDARHLLQAHRWPGNVRELRNAVERAAILADGPLLEASDFGDLPSRRVDERLRIGDFVTLEALAQEHVRLVTDRATNYQDAARVLGVNTSTLYRWRKRADDSLARFEPDPVAARAG